MLIIIQVLKKIKNLMLETKTCSLLYLFPRLPGEDLDDNHDPFWIMNIRGPVIPISPCRYK